MARDDIGDGTNNVVNGEWRRGQRVPIPMVAAPVSGIIQNSKGTLDEQIHRARDTQKKFFLFSFLTLRVHTLAYFFLARIFIPIRRSTNNFDLDTFIFTLFKYRLSSTEDRASF